MCAMEGFPATPWPESKGSWEVALSPHVHSGLTHGSSGQVAGWTSRMDFEWAEPKGTTPEG